MNSTSETEIVKFGVIRQEKYRTDGNMSEITESRVSSRVKGIEREVEKQSGGGTAEKKIKMSREEEEGGICVTKSQSQKSTQELSRLTSSHHKINPETGAVSKHSHGGRNKT